MTRKLFVFFLRISCKSCKMPAKRGRKGGRKDEKVIEIDEEPPAVLGGRQDSASSITTAFNRMVSEREVIKIKEEEREDNLRIIIYLTRKKGQWFCPSLGGTLVFNPQETGQVNAVKKKMAEINAKLKKLRKFYRVVQMSRFTTTPVTAVGGAQVGYKGLQLPPSMKAMQKPEDEI